MADDPWTDVQYTAYLEAERRRYAWVMRTYGDLPADQADEAALERYPHEPPGIPYRGLIFHDLAWQWAMLALKGEYYWTRYPKLARPPAEYEALG